MEEGFAKTRILQILSQNDEAQMQSEVELEGQDDKVLVQYVYGQSLMLAPTAANIITSTADMASSKLHLLPNELIAKFKDLKLVKVMVSNFIQSIEQTEQGHSQKESKNNNDKKDENDAYELLSEFIYNYALNIQNHKSLDAFIKQLRETYPKISIVKLLKEPKGNNKALNNELESQIENSLLPEVVESQYEAIFNYKRNLKKANSAIADYVFYRAISVNTKGELDVNEHLLDELLQFLDKIGYNLEGLYMVLYREMKAMLAIKNKLAGITGEARKSLSRLDRKILRSRKIPFLYKKFNFDEFFYKQFVPKIRKIREGKLTSKGKLHLADVEHINPQALQQHIYPSRANQPIKEEAKLIQNDAKLIAEIKAHLNYADSSSKKLSVDEIRNQIQIQLQGAAEQIKYTIGEALKCKPKDDPIHEDYKFYPEIIDNRNIAQLMKWLSAPEQFLKNYPHYKKGKNSKAIVAHQCRKMLQLFAFYRKYVFSKFKHAKKDAAKLEVHLKDRLQIENQCEQIVSYRTGCIIDPVTKKPILGTPLDPKSQGKKNNPRPQYKISYDAELLKDNPKNQVERTIDGQTILYNPVETKTFQKIHCTIPVRRGKSVEGDIMIASNDDKLINSKPLESYISSLLREKEPTDLVRWTIVVEDPKFRDALMAFLYENFGGDPEKIEDMIDGRFITNKNKGAYKPGSTDFFKAHQDAAFAFYATLPIRKGNDIDHHHIPFETQIFNLDKLLIYGASNYTESSHTQFFTPEREWKNLHTYFFPPIIYGTKYADHLLAGHR